MANYIYITCGTSTITKHNDEKLRNAITRHSNTKNGEELGDDKQIIEDHIGNLFCEWEAYSKDEAKRKSAEINCLTAWQTSRNVRNEECCCTLLHTDTYLGGAAASILEAWLTKNGYTFIESISIPGLNTASAESFETGLSNLAICAFDKVGEVGKGHRIIFNIAGGFKSVAGFTQILGQFLADETIYMFESGNSVLSMPRLPIRWDEIDSFSQNIDDYRRVALGLEPKDRSKLNTLWLKDNGFSPWGRIAWENAKKELYSKRVYPIVCDGVVEGVKFQESIKGLDPLRIKMVNDRLDDLCLFALSGKRDNIRRLDYKQVKGNHDCKFECDAWADGSAKRFFCNERDGKIIVEYLGKALH